MGLPPHWWDGPCRYWDHAEAGEHQDEAQPGLRAAGLGEVGHEGHEVAQSDYVENLDADGGDQAADAGDAAGP